MPGQSLADARVLGSRCDETNPRMRYTPTLFLIFFYLVMTTRRKGLGGGVGFSAPLRGLLEDLPLICEFSLLCEAVLKAHN